MKTLTNEDKRSKVAAVIALCLLLGSSLVYIGMQHKSSKSLGEALKAQKLTGESLLSEKLGLEKELQKLRSELKSGAEKNIQLDKLVNSTNKQLEVAQAQLKQAERQRASIAQLRKENQELAQVKNEIEEQLKFYKNALASKQASEKDFEKHLALLQKQNKELSDALNELNMNSMNSVLTQAVKKNGKLTVKSRRTNKLIANVDVPSSVAALSFRITDPSGKELTSHEGTLTVHRTEPNQSVVYASTSQGIPSLAFHTIEMIYTPKKDLQPGTYNIEVKDNLKTIGSLQVKLR